MLNKRFDHIRQLTHLNDNYTHGNVVVLADGISPCLTNAMGSGGGHIPIVLKERIMND